MSTELTANARRFTARKALFSFLGRVFRVFSPEGELRYYIKQKAFRLKEQMNVFTDEAQSNVAIAIQARSVFDFGATYDVTDPGTGERLGAWRRQGLKSIFRDEWTMLDASDNAVGKIIEDSILMGLLRRFVLHSLFPQTFSVHSHDAVVGAVRQRFNPFQLAYDVDCSEATDIDPRMLVAGVILLLSIEGRQQ